MFETSTSKDSFVLKPGVSRKVKISHDKEITITDNIKFDMLSNELEKGIGVKFNVSKKAEFSFSHSSDKTQLSVKITL